MRNLNLVYPEISDVKYIISRFPDGQQTVDLEGTINNTASKYYAVLTNQEVEVKECPECGHQHPE